MLYKYTVVTVPIEPCKTGHNSDMYKFQFIGYLTKQGSSNIIPYFYTHYLSSFSCI